MSTVHLFQHGITIEPTFVALGLGRLQVGDGGSLTAKAHSLMPSRQKAIRPIVRTARRQAAWIGQDDEGGQFVGLASQTVGKPRAHHGKSHQTKTRMGLENGGRMIAGAGHHRADDGQLIGALGQMREQLGDPQAALASLLESPMALVQQTHLAKEDVGLFAARKRLAMIFLEGRFVIERIDLAESAGEKDLNRPLRLRRMVGWQVGGFAGNGGRLQQTVAREQTGQGNTAESAAKLCQKIAPAGLSGRRSVGRFRSSVHRFCSINVQELVAVEDHQA